VKGFIEEMKPLNARSVPLKEKPEDIFFFDVAMWQKFKTFFFLLILSARRVLNCAHHLKEKKIGERLLG